MTHQDQDEGRPFRRPIPFFGTAEAHPKDMHAEDLAGMQRPTILLQRPAAAKGAMPQDEAPYIEDEIGLDMDVVDDPHLLYPLSVDDMRTKLFALGISKSKDSIQRYCREGTLDCVKLGMFRRYFATEQSFTTLAETLQTDAAASTGMQLDEGAGTEDTTGLHDRHTPAASLMQLHAAGLDDTLAEDKELHAPAEAGMQADEGARSRMDMDCWFPRGTEPVFPPRSEPPLSMVF